MAQTIKSILSAIAASVLTMIFGWITLRGQVINGKADIKYVDNKIEVVEEADAVLQKQIDDNLIYNMSEHEKIETRYLREITLTRELLQDLKKDIRDLKTKP